MKLRERDMMFISLGMRLRGRDFMFIPLGMRLGEKDIMFIPLGMRLRARDIMFIPLDKKKHKPKIICDSTFQQYIITISVINLMINKNRATKLATL